MMNATKKFLFAKTLSGMKAGFFFEDYADTLSYAGKDGGAPFVGLTSLFTFYGKEYLSVVSKAEAIESRNPERFRQLEDMRTLRWMGIDPATVRDKDDNFVFELDAKGELL